MIVDAHVNVGIREQIWGLKKHTPEDQIALMEKCDIDLACIFSPAPGLIRPEHFIEGNDYVAEATRLFPDRFIPFAILNPWYRSEALDELNRNLDRGFAGIKLYPPGHGFYPIDSPLVDPICEAAIENDVAVLIHTDFNTKICSPYHFAALARRYPEAKLIMAHLGMDPDVIHFIPDIIEDLPNAYVEISCTPDIPEAAVGRPVKRLGSRRVLFASDAPGLAPELAILKVELATLDKEDHEEVMGKAFMRLIPEDRRPKGYAHAV